MRSLEFLACSHGASQIGCIQISNADRLLASESAPNNALLLFNRMLAGDVPQSAPGAYTWLE